MLDNNYSVTEAEEGLWVIEIPFVRSYLIVGEERAFLVDTGMGNFDWKKAIAQITNRPIIVVNTHGHEDHCRGDDQFSQVYIHPADIEKARAFGGMEGVEFLPITGGEVFDIGGTVIEAIAAPGHTLGSMAFLDRTHRRLFTGDLVNSDSVIMNRDGGEYLTGAYHETMEKLWARREEFDGVYSDHNRYPLPVESLKELRDLSEKILRGEIQGEPYRFLPAADVPPLEGTVYRMQNYSMLYINGYTRIIN